MRINVIAFTSSGCRTALRLRDRMPDEDIGVFCKTSAETSGVRRIDDVRGFVKESFAVCDALVFIGATGIAVRYIAPYIVSKDVDPAVICMDERADYTVSLLSGHIGGGNELTLRIAGLMDSVPVVSTATDINGRFSVDTFAVRNSLRISDLRTAKDISSAVLRGEEVGFDSDLPVSGGLPEGLVRKDSGRLGICISRNGRRPFGETLVLTPMDIILGIGCRKGTDPEKLSRFVRDTLEEDGIDPVRVNSVCSIDVKKDEHAITDLARGLKVPFRYYTAEQLNSLDGEFTGSDFVKRTVGVDSVCERSAVYRGGELIRKKTPREGMTIAIARMDIEPRF